MFSNGYLDDPKERWHRGSNMRRRISFVLTGCLFWFAASASAQVVSAFHNYSSYGVYNCLYQWYVGPNSNTVRALGLVNLGVGGLFNYDIALASGDIAMLSDRTVVITHQTNGAVNVVSVLQPLYDKPVADGGVLTGVTVVATYPEVRKLVAPLPNRGFVCLHGNNGTATMYTQTAVNVWSATIVSGLQTEPYDLVGLVAQPDNWFVTGGYDRGGHKISKTGQVVVYTNGFKAWGYTSNLGEGLRNPLLINPWVITGDTGEMVPSMIFDGTEADGGSYNGRKGKILNADGSEIYLIPWAGLADGRIAAPWLMGWLQAGVTWRVFTPIQDPAFQPPGSIGATGPDFEAYTAGNLVGRFAGDYMYQEPAPGGTVVIDR
jgi:hypothetical protein